MIWNFVKGMLMGIADIVPGVSGGTIALLTGIYERLIGAIKSVGLDTLKILFLEVNTLGLKGLVPGIKKAWLQIDGTFLLSVVSGMAASILLLSQAMHYLIENVPMFIWPCFFGLVLGSVFFVGKQIKNWDIQKLLLALGGAIFAASIALSSPMQLEITALNLFLSGAVAICAMILPGISGGFILLLIGVYGSVIAAIKGFDLNVLLIFGLGCLVGIMSFSRFLSWLLNRFHDAVLAVLTGFMLGALVKLWPWKEVISYRVNSKGLEVPFLEQPTWPWLHPDSQLLLVLTGASLGLGCVLLMDYLANKKKMAHK